MQVNTLRSSLTLEMLQSEPNFCSLAVIVPAHLVDTLYEQAVLSQKNSTAAFGFHKRETPTSYIEQNYQSIITDHLKEFFLKFMVMGFLYQEILRKKILVAGQPRLHSILLQPGHNAHFSFELSLFPAITFQEWKYLPFKAPKRKNYKDLDRQVESFLQEEIAAKQNYLDDSIRIGDWVNYQINILNNDKHPLLNGTAADLWIKIGDEEPDKPFQELFLRKKTGQDFISNAQVLQDFFSDSLHTNYNFGITIMDVVPNAYLCIDQFKHHFRIKTNKEMYQKLIEVFSYRNDLSQRRTMVEESLKLLLSKHRFEVPQHFVLRQQKKVLDIIQFNPDYHVYRVQKDFKEAVKDLAEKQAKEEIFLDQLAYEENLDINHTDLKNYLNLTKRPRMREFLHFDPLMSKIRGQECAIMSDELGHVCLREKTINHIIYHLTKK